jgi:serine/threonine-protein kinase
MSPEQLSGGTVDGRSDIYALALVAFNMLTGKLPFPADTAQESMIMRLTDAPRKLAEMRPDVAWPADVQGALDKALARDVEARYRSASEFGQTLANALDRMPHEEGTASQSNRGLAAADQPTLPVTRVAPDRRPAAAAPVASRGTVAPPARRNRLMYAVGGMVLAAALIGAMVVMRGPGGSAVKQDSVTPLGRPTSDVRKPDTIGTAQQRNSVKLAGTVASGSSAQRSVATPPPADVTAMLDSLEKIVSHDVTPNEAASVVRTLEQMKDRISGNEQRVQAAVIDALAESSRNRPAAACAALRNVQSIAPTTTRKNMVNYAVGQSC